MNQKIDLHFLGSLRSHATADKVTWSSVSLKSMPFRVDRDKIKSFSKICLTLVSLRLNLVNPLASKNRNPSEKIKKKLVSKSLKNLQTKSLHQFFKTLWTSDQNFWKNINDLGPFDFQLNNQIYQQFEHLNEIIKLKLIQSTRIQPQIVLKTSTGIKYKQKVTSNISIFKLFSDIFWLLVR